MTYNCTVPAPRSIIWAIGRWQIQRSDDFDAATSIGIYVEPPNTNSQMSTITLSQMTWDAALEGNVAIIAVTCLSVEGMLDNIIAVQTYGVFIVCK